MTADELIAELDLHSGDFPRGWAHDADASIRQAIADQQEACAVVCDELSAGWWSEYKTGHGPHRADLHYQGKSAGAEECAAAIRARGVPP